MSTAKKRDRDVTPNRIGSSADSMPQTAEKNLLEFCRAAGHELGNVLGTIVGELDHGLSSQDLLARSRAMSVALEAAERALTLARNLRYFAVHPKLEMQHMDVSQLLLDTVEMVEKDLKSHHIKMTVLVEASRFVNVDPGALQQTLFNLFSRASQTMPQGGRLSVIMRTSGKHLEIACADTGVGIPSERLEEIFEPRPSGQTTALDVQGLELAVAKALIEAQGGAIRVESGKQGGTTFTLAFPFDPEAARPERTAEHRRFRRVNATLPVEVSFGGKQPFNSELQTLSIRGCFIAIPEAQLATLPAPDSTGSLRIYYYQDQVLDISKCRIAAHSSNNGVRGLGIEFVDFDAKARKLLEAIVQSHPFE